MANVFHILVGQRSSSLVNLDGLQVARYLIAFVAIEGRQRPQ